MARAPKGKYNIALLQTIIDRDLCKIDLENYTKVTGKSTIIFTCVCGNQHRKSFQHLYERSALCNDCIIKNGVIKIKATNLEKYGTENTFQVPEFKEKARQTILLKYGTENVLQNPEIQEKIKQTNLLRYGTENPAQNTEVREKTKQTNLIRYGTDSPAQNLEIQEKTKQSNFVKYGTEYPNQNPEMYEKQQTNAFKYKDYILPNSDIIKVQGYEPFALDVLFNLGYTQDDIITSKSDVPEIWYYNEETKHRYFCDIYIISINKIIEVKSEWTYEVNKEKNILKAEACIKEGYDFEFWIIDKDGSYRIINPAITDELFPTVIIDF